jgi:hypothetical protein
MVEKNSIRPISVLLTVAFFLSGCEGFKILTLHNKTGKEITVETRPEIPRFKHTSLVDTVQTLFEAKTYRLLPDSSLSLLTTFTGLLFNAKIREQDLPIDFLKIETPTDTIIANNRHEIIKLIKDPKLRYKSVDKTYAWDDNKNIEAIIVRQ